MPTARKACWFHSLAQMQLEEGVVVDVLAWVTCVSN